MYSMPEGTMEEEREMEGTAMMHVLMDLLDRIGPDLTLKTSKRPGLILVRNEITGREYQVDLDKVDAVPAKRLEAILSGLPPCITTEEAGAVRELVEAGK
jgi:hypothetical protein